MKKGYLLMLLVVLFVCAQFVACANGTTGDSQEDDTEPTVRIEERAVIYVARQEDEELISNLLNKYLQESEKYRDCTFVLNLKTTENSDGYKYGDIVYVEGQEFLKVQSEYKLMPLTGSKHEDQVRKRDDKASVKAFTVDDKLYAFPCTSKTGYFMYYDKSVITNPKSLEAIVAACQATNTKMVFDVNNVWYADAFFMATGYKPTNTYKDGKLTSYDFNYNVPGTVVAYRELCELANSGVTVPHNIDGVHAASVYISGLWDIPTIKKSLGDNYATAILPTFEGADGNTYHMHSYSDHAGYVVMYQDRSVKAQYCLDLASYLSSEEVQRAMLYDSLTYPSNLEVQKDKLVQDKHALFQQMEYANIQPQTPLAYWESYTIFPNNVSDEELYNELINRVERIKNSNGY